jgi:hypothetical protein
MVSSDGVPALGLVRFTPFCEVPDLSAFGVGHSAAASFRFGPPVFGRLLRLEFAPPVGVVGVGHSEGKQPLALVRSTDFFRCNEDRRNSVTHFS